MPGIRNRHQQYGPDVCCNLQASSRLPTGIRTPRRRSRSRRRPFQAEVGRRKLARWAADNAIAIKESSLLLPPNLGNRLAANWRLLLAIAESRRRQPASAGARGCRASFSHRTQTELGAAIVGGDAGHVRLRARPCENSFHTAWGVRRLPRRRSSRSFYPIPTPRGANTLAARPSGAPVWPAVYYVGKLSDKLSLARAKRLGHPRINRGEGAAMQQIADWLTKLGMSEYAERFAENGIDVSVLPHLTDQDLKDIGVLLGHRRKMLAAIGKLAGAAPAKPEPALAREPQTQDTAERRQVTVMFSDLVGSTALSARMDPEDLRDVISGYQKCVAQTVQRFGGFVAKYMGDGVLVYFGYPQAHEDDAERAVRAGLELVAEVGGLKSPVPLQTRVGIATGLVIVGDLIGTGSAQEQTIVGETPNLAARLQGIAEPNTVVIAESTRKLLGNLFDLQDLGAQDLKGIGEAVKAWAALRPASIESRFEALHASGLTELVGREEELEILMRRWAKSKTGEGQVVLLSGEAGIGKSRLTAALLEHLTAEPHIRLRYFCSPQRTDSALYPIVSQMERATGVAPDDTAQTKLDRLDVMLAQTATSMQDAALFAEMLSLPNDGRYPAIELTPEQRRKRTLEALISQLGALTQKSPVLMIFEDAHWTDPTSLEVFGLVIDRIRSIRVLLLVTFRPEFDAPWVGRPYVSSLALNRLGERDISAMTDRVVGNNPLPANIRQDIVERTDGIPLFVEEMTKAVLEAGSEGEVQRTVASIPSTTVGVPASLQASLMARLDRLGSAKEAAQIGAAIGREFSHTLLSAVARKSEPELASALDRLISAGLLFRQGVPPHSTYLFKHALVQDAAYGTLLREPRRALHARIAETLESQFTEIAENQPELLARHCTEASLIEKAAGLWGNTNPHIE
jgi:class 3 adenylate cyclase